MNTEAVRAFVAVVEEGRFQDAALVLGVSQQAVSKRVASLERLLGVPLFDRGPRRNGLTADGRAFLPHARALLAAADRALRSVGPGARGLRVDVLGRRLASADLLRRFHEARPGVELDVLVLPGVRAAVAALLDGSIDAAFGCPRDPGALPAAIRHALVYDEPLELLVGPRHPLADARPVRLTDLRGHRLRVPGAVPGTEWADFYRDLAGAFGVEIDSTGPNLGVEHLLDTVAGSRTVATFVGARSRIVWPAHHGLRRVPLADPTPCYPWSLLWHADAMSPALTELIGVLTAGYAPHPAPSWSPAWAARGR